LSQSSGGVGTASLDLTLTLTSASNVEVTASLLRHDLDRVSAGGGEVHLYVADTHGVGYLIQQFVSDPNSTVNLGTSLFLQPGTYAFSASAQNGTATTDNPIPFPDQVLLLSSAMDSYNLTVRIGGGDSAVTPTASVLSVGSVLLALLAISRFRHPSAKIL
jgi:hypothetical protein